MSKIKHRMPTRWDEIDPIVNDLVESDHWGVFISSCADWIYEIAPQLSENDRDEIISICIIAYQTGYNVLKRKIEEITC